MQAEQALVNMLQGFATLQSPKILSFPAEVSLSTVHDFFLNHIILAAHFNNYPPSRDYQYLFWKWAIQHLEGLPHDEDIEIDERIYSHLISLMPNSSSMQNVGTAPPAQSYVTYLWKMDGMGDTVVYPGYAHATLFESRTTIESGTTGLRTWPASLALAHYVIKHPESVCSKRILELGCGAGFLGEIIATIQLGADPSQRSSALWLTDVNDSVLQLCRNNTKLSCNLSSRHSDLNFTLLDWTHAENHSDDPDYVSMQNTLAKIDPDLILGADIVYDPSIIVPLVKTLHLALTIRRAQAPLALIALTIRNEETFAQFLSAACEVLLVSEIEQACEETVFGLKINEHMMHGSQQIKILQIKPKTSQSSRPES